jgi:single-stranded-DNA-specific exonuclease
MKKQWNILKPDKHHVEQLCTALEIHPLTATILVNRNITSSQQAKFFLHPTLENIRPPFSIQDMDIAVERIVKAIQDHEKILIFGDYDVDGVTSTVILYQFLKYSGTDVSAYLPHRIDEGYGLHARHIDEVAIPRAIDLIITVDCGSSSHEAVRKARDAGIDVVITDHHNVSTPHPNAAAFVNPKRSDCTTGFNDLAGVGVVFFLIVCLRKHLRDKGFWEEKPEPNLKNCCDLVSLGTVADMVPLVLENRILSRIGIELINSGSRDGIKALKQISGLKENDAAGAEDIAFKLAPRLNAAGRIAHADKAMDLLCCDNIDAALLIAQSLNELNGHRRGMEDRILDEALALIEKQPEMLGEHTLTLAHPDWHEGILGIVASRIVQRYYRPVVLISIKDGVGKGSARSIPGIDIYEAFCSCSGDLKKYGGHAMAAGLSIDAEKIPAFRNNFEQAVSAASKPEDYIAEIKIDSELDFEDISDRLMDEIESLRPFGCGNPEPVFMAKNLEVSNARKVGRHHRRMTLRQRSGSGARTVNAIHFNPDPEAAGKQYFEQMAFRLRWNRYNGSQTLQIVVEDV